MEQGLRKKVPPPETSWTQEGLSAEAPSTRGSYLPPHDYVIQDESLKVLAPASSQLWYFVRQRFSEFVFFLLGGGIAEKKACESRNVRSAGEIPDGQHDDIKSVFKPFGNTTMSKGSRLKELAAYCGVQDTSARNLFIPTLMVVAGLGLGWAWRPPLGSHHQLSSKVQSMSLS